MALVLSWTSKLCCSFVIGMYSALKVADSRNKSFGPIVFPQSLKDLIKATSASMGAMDWEEQASRFISTMVLLLIRVNYGLI